MYLYYLLALDELDKIELEHVLGFEYDKESDDVCRKSNKSASIMEKDLKKLMKRY